MPRLSRWPVTRIQFGFGFFCFRLQFIFLMIAILFIYFCPSPVLALLKTTLTEEGNRKYSHIWCWFWASTWKSGFMGSKRVPPLLLAPSRHQPSSSFSCQSQLLGLQGHAVCCLCHNMEPKRERKNWFTLIRCTKIDKVKLANTAH